MILDALILWHVGRNVFCKKSQPDNEHNGIRNHECLDRNADLKVKGVIGSAETDREIILDLSFQILHL